MVEGEKRSPYKKTWNMALGGEVFLSQPSTTQTLKV